VSLKVIELNLKYFSIIYCAAKELIKKDLRLYFEVFVRSMPFRKATIQNQVSFKQ